MSRLSWGSRRSRERSADGRGKQPAGGGPDRPQCAALGRRSPPGSRRAAAPVRRHGPGSPMECGMLKWTRAPMSYKRNNFLTLALCPDVRKMQQTPDEVTVRFTAFIGSLRPSRSHFSMCLWTHEKKTIFSCQRLDGCWSEAYFETGAEDITYGRDKSFQLGTDRRPCADPRRYRTGAERPAQPPHGRLCRIARRIRRANLHQRPRKAGRSGRA